MCLISAAVSYRFSHSNCWNENCVFDVKKSELLKSCAPFEICIFPPYCMYKKERAALGGFYFFDFRSLFLGRRSWLLLAVFVEFASSLPFLLAKQLNFRCVNISFISLFAFRFDWEGKWSGAEWSVWGRNYDYLLFIQAAARKFAGHFLKKTQIMRCAITFPRRLKCDSLETQFLQFAEW